MRRTRPPTDDVYRTTLDCEHVAFTPHQVAAGVYYCHICEKHVRVRRSTLHRRGRRGGD